MESSQIPTALLMQDDFSRTTSMIKASRIWTQSLTFLWQISLMEKLFVGISFLNTNKSHSCSSLHDYNYKPYYNVSFWCIIVLSCTPARWDCILALKMETNKNLCLLPNWIRNSFWCIPKYSLFVWGSLDIPMQTIFRTFTGEVTFQNKKFISE